MFLLLSKRMIDLSLDELRLIAQNRNISNYENKSEQDLIKALSEPETKPKRKQTRKPEPEPKPKPEMSVNKKKLKKLTKYFDKLRHKFSKNEIKEYRKAFYIAKNYKYLSESEIKKKNKLLSESEINKTNKNINELKKNLRFKKFNSNIDSVDYEDHNNYDDNYDFVDDDKYRKIGSIRTLFKEFDRDYQKPIRTNDGLQEEETIT